MPEMDADEYTDNALEAILIGDLSTAQVYALLAIAERLLDLGARVGELLPTPAPTPVPLTPLGPAMSGTHAEALLTGRHVPQ